MNFDERGSNDRLKLICQYKVYSGRRNMICYKSTNTGQVDRKTKVKGACTGKEAIFR